MPKRKPHHLERISNKVELLLQQGLDALQKEHSPKNQSWLKVSHLVLLLFQLPWVWCQLFFTTWILVCLELSLVPLKLGQVVYNKVFIIQ